MPIKKKEERSNIPPIRTITTTPQDIKDFFNRIIPIAQEKILELAKADGIDIKIKNPEEKE